MSGAYFQGTRLSKRLQMATKCKLVDIKVVRKQEFLAGLNAKGRLWIKWSSVKNLCLLRPDHSSAWLLRKYKMGQLYISF